MLEKADNIGRLDNNEKRNKKRIAELTISISTHQLKSLSECDPARHATGEVLC